MSQVTVADFGTRLGGFTDPTGDDNGPGSYVYPTNSAYVPGAFDLTKLDVFINGTQAFFVAKIAGQVTNPFGGDHISLQHLNVYLGSSNGNPVPALPGTNLNVATPWNVAIVGDGRFSAAGAYVTDASELASATLITVPQTHQIAVGIPLSALNGLDLTTAYYGTAMFDNCQSNEGIGFVRPVYSLAFWSNPGPGLSFIPQFFFGGGAGQATFSGANDTDTSDPNAIDIIVGPGQSQSEVLNWQLHSPCVLPMLPLGHKPPCGSRPSSRLLPLSKKKTKLCFPKLRQMCPANKIAPETKLPLSIDEFRIFALEISYAHTRRWRLRLVCPPAAAIFSRITLSLNLIASSSIMTVACRKRDAGVTIAVELDSTSESLNAPGRQLLLRIDGTTTIGMPKERLSITLLSPPCVTNTCVCGKTAV